MTEKKDTKRKARRPDDPHMAQLQAVEALVPTVDDDVDAPEPAGVEIEELKGPTMPELTPDVVQMLEGMRQQIAKLEAQVQAGPVGDAGDVVQDAGPSGWPWQYYKRPEVEGGLMSGWIVAGPGGATPRGQRDAGSYTKYTGGKGFKALTKYGACPVPNSPVGSRVFITMLENGGAQEFPVAQVVAYKWHVDPPIPGLTFPDYEANKDRVRHFMCDDCDHEVYFVEDDREVALSCFRHLRNDSKDGRHGMRREEAVMVLRSQGIETPAGRFAAAAAKKEVEGLAGAPSE